MHLTPDVKFLFLCDSHESFLKWPGYVYLKNLNEEKLDYILNQRFVCVS